MRSRALAMVICCGFLIVSCGDDRTPPPTAPSGPPTAIALQISGAASPLAIGESQRLQAVVRYSDGTSTPAAGPVTWRSSNDAVLATWSDGVVVAMSPGEAAISAMAGNLTASSTFVVAHRDGDLRRIEGRVLDFVSQAGVGGATLVFNTADQGLSSYAGTAETDLSGNYTIALPAGDFQVTVGAGAPAVLVVRVGSPAFRGDFYVNGGACISRYGIVIDATTYRPVAGATVTYGSGAATTGPDGSYRIDHPCVGSVSGNTITVNVTHPEYLPGRRFSGRGLSSVIRLDFALQRP